jgi:hypothetical protein
VFAERLGRESSDRAELVVFQRPTEDELVEAINVYIDRLRANGYEPLDARQQPTPWEWRNRDRTIGGRLEIGPTEATWVWCSLR